MALATQTLKQRAIELHKGGLNAWDTWVTLCRTGAQVSHVTVWRWIKAYQAEQAEQNAQKSKEVA